MADPVLSSGAGTGNTASAAARAANAARTSMPYGGQPMQVDAGMPGPPPDNVFVKDGDSPRKIESSIFPGEEQGNRKGRGRQRKQTQPQAKSWNAPSPEMPFGAGYPYPAMSMPYPPNPGYYMPGAYQYAPMMPHMYPGMPMNMPMFPHMPLPAPEQQAAVPKGKGRGRQDPSGGGKAALRDKGKRRTKGKHPKERSPASPWRTTRP
ncbi:unnamed protein product, partial [Effrenium voratum]